MPMKTTGPPGDSLLCEQGSARAIRCWGHGDGWPRQPSIVASAQVLAAIEQRGLTRDTSPQHQGQCRERWLRTSSIEAGVMIHQVSSSFWGSHGAGARRSQAEAEQAPPDGRVAAMSRCSQQGMAIESRQRPWNTISARSRIRAEGNGSGCGHSHLGAVRM